MKRYLILALVLLAVLVGPAMATDYSQSFEAVGSGSAAVTSIKYLVTSYPSELTEGTIEASGRNLTVSGNGVYDYGIASGTYSMQAYNNEIPKNYSFDVEFSFTTDKRNSYDANWTATYVISNLQTFNLSRPTGSGVFQLRGPAPALAIYGQPSFYKINYPTGATTLVTYPYHELMIGSDNYKVASAFYNMVPPTPPAPPTAAYVCNFDQDYPYEGNPFNLACSDDSGAYPEITVQNWTLSLPDDTEYSSSNETLIRTLTQDGWYGLEYRACNSYGCGYSNTSTLINISSTVQETGISFWVHTYDPITGAKIGPSDIGIGNVTSGGWRNTSTSLGTANFDSTDYARLEKLTVGQNVNLCGEAPGYQETCTNVSIAYDGWEYILNLVRTDLVPAGNQSTMIVNVINSNTAQTISGVTLTVSNSSVPYSSSKLSDSTGIATFSNIPAAGSYQITASKTGYVSATKYWPVYPGAVANAYIGLLPVGVTPVPTGPGGDPIYVTPTTTTTYAPGETPDTRTDAEKDEDMMGLLRDQGPMLIQFFIVCFVVYMIMGMAGKGGR